MILKALYDYYNRCIEYDHYSLPRYGTMNAQISFIVNIDLDGNYIRLEDSRQDNGKGKTFVVPYGVHTNAVTPFLFWDNCLYAFGYIKPLNETEVKDPKKVQKWEKSSETVQKKHNAFIELCKKIANETKNDRLLAVTKFYTNNQLLKLMSSEEWKLIEANSSANISFRILDDTQLVSSLPVLLNFIESDSAETGVCLVTGIKGPIVRKSTPTPIPGCNASASLVAFQKDYGFDSYGKSQAYNAPISLEAEFAFSTALKKLKEPESKNKFSINDRLFVYFASQKSETTEKMEDVIAVLFNKTDDPNSNIELVKSKVKSIFSGIKHGVDNTYFYVIGIAPNLGREAIIYYSEIPLSEFAKVLNEHFDDMEVLAPRYEKPYVGLYSMLKAIALKNEIKNCPPNLPDAVVKSIFQGLPYPFTLYAACIRRIRAEREVAPYYNTCRVAIIKAYLNRLNDTNNKKLDIMLDKENTNQGYLCGRLFATLERIQEKSNNNTSTIRERYMNAASATPVAVFTTLLNLSNHHSEKLNAGAKIHYEKIKQEIIDKIMPDGFPAHLDLQDQGRFFVGYYHQRQDFFTSKNENNEQE